MIEGVIVVSTMLVFLGLIQFTRQSYGKKLDLQQQTRSTTMFFASHGCEGDNGGGGDAPSGSKEAENAAGKSNVPNKAAASRHYNTASTSASDSASFQAIWDNNADGTNRPMDLQKHTLTRSLSAKSKVTCNEKKYDNQWTAWMQFGIDFVGRGFGGLGDLFQ
jgi:hypothetical protein